MTAFKKQGLRFLAIATLLFGLSGLSGCSLLDDCPDTRRKLP